MSMGRYLEGADALTRPVTRKRPAAIAPDTCADCAVIAPLRPAFVALTAPRELRLATVAAP